jgi:PKD repeat protein
VCENLAEQSRSRGPANRKGAKIPAPIAYSISVCVLLAACSACFGAPLTYSPQSVSLADSPGKQITTVISVTSPAPNVQVDGPKVSSVAPYQPIPASWVSCSPSGFRFKKNQLSKGFTFHFDIPGTAAPGVYVSRVGMQVVSDNGQGVTDGEGTLVTLRVKGPPVASFSSAPTSPLAGQSVQFTDTSSDPDNAIVSWNWNFGDGATSSQQNPAHSFSAAGTYTVTLTVTDGDGLTDSESKQIKVSSPVAPTASFNFSPASPVEGDSVQFTDTSTAGTYPIVSWSWDFGDGATSSQQNPTHAYSDSGAYTVRLTVVDSGGLSGSASLQVAVQNAPPTADAGPERSCNVGDTLNFSASFTDPGSADTHTFSWDFGDGSTASERDVSHAYAAPGEYTVTLTVEDDDGGAGTDTAQVTVTQGAVEPTASFTFQPAVPIEGDSVQFTDSSSAGSFPIVSWSWDFGDGLTSQQRSPLHAYAENGNYTVELSITDSTGASSSFSLPLVVSNAAPVVDAGPDRVARVGDTISFEATVRDAGALDCHTVVWDFGDGRQAKGRTVRHGFSSPGAYTVTAAASDNDGAVGEDSLVVQVIPASGGSGGEAAQAFPSANVLLEYNGPSFVQVESAARLSCLVSPADGMDAAAVEGAQVVFQAWSVPDLSRTEIVGSAAGGAAAVAAQLASGTYLVSAGAFGGRGADITRPMASVLVVSSSNNLAAGAARFAHGNTLWSVGFRLAGAGDSQPDLPSASFALTGISGSSSSSAPRTVVSERIESAQVTTTGVTMTGVCQVDGVHGYPFRLVVWRTWAGASFQLTAGKDISVSGDIPPGQFAFVSTVIPM